VSNKSPIVVRISSSPDMASPLDGLSVMEIDGVVGILTDQEIVVHRP